MNPFVKIKLSLLMIIFMTSCSENQYSEIIPVEFAVDSVNEFRAEQALNIEAMLSSFQQVGDLYTMTFHGDFDALVALHHQEMMTYYDGLDSLEQDPFLCSLFSYQDQKGKVVLGRNFDNKQTELLAGLFIPDSGYRSLGLIPMIEFGFSERNPFDPESHDDRRLLLYAALVTVDGINEKGLTVTVASNSRQTVMEDTLKPYRHMQHLTRNLLDHAEDVNEAIEIASGYNLFDNGKHVMNHHLLIADPTGKSVVLEWDDGEMHILKSNEIWQIATNTDIYQESETDLVKGCDRYEAIYEHLSKKPDSLSWQAGMDILQTTVQTNQTYTFEEGPITINTVWSAIFELHPLRLNICLESKYEKVYQFSPF